MNSQALRAALAPTDGTLKVVRNTLTSGMDALLDTHYQGQPIGDTGTLELPPLVGPEVPVAAPPAGYPADCPCRRPRTFTVEVLGITIVPERP